VATVLGGVPSPWALLAVPAAVLTGAAMASPLMAFAATQEEDGNFGLVMRLLVLPLFLFSGTFFPVAQLPGVLPTLAWVSPLWHGIELARAATTGRWAEMGAAAGALHVLVLVAVLAVGVVAGRRTFAARLAI
jgi:lipooligosaccharide transport system permease protein